MKAYLVASLNQKETFLKVYKSIVSALEHEGVVVEAEHIMEPSLKEVSGQTDEQRSTFYKKFLKDLSKTDIVVAEVSYPSSIGVGSAVSIALEREKPTLALYEKGREPHFLKGLGLENDKLFLYEYDSIDDIENLARRGLRKLKQVQDIRFNFFISPKISNYLDWVAKERRIPRSVYLRRLIEEDMKQNSDYS